MEREIYDNIYGYYSDLISKIENNQASNYISLNKGTIFEGLLFDDFFYNIKEIASGRNFQEFINIFYFENHNQEYSINKEIIKDLLLSEIGLLEYGQKVKNIDYKAYLDELLIRLQIFSHAINKN